MFAHAPVFELADAAATEHVGHLLSRALPGAEAACIVYLHGELGSGKTTLVRGFLRARGVAGPVRSPTYTLIEPHAVGAEVFVHVDLYRLNAPSEIDDLALGDYLAARHVLLIEWPEKGAGRLPAADLELTLSYAGAGRELLMQSHGELGRRWLTNLATDTSLIPYLSNIT